MAIDVEELRRTLHATPLDHGEPVIGLTRECIAALLAELDDGIAARALLRKEQTVARICAQLLGSADARTAL